jgi:hypothetical protein
MKIAVFFHGLFFIGDAREPAPSAVAVIGEQMAVMAQSGLLEAADYLAVGINGSGESLVYTAMLIPEKAHVVFHGLDSRNENATVRLMETWLPEHPGWAVLYFHAKGATWPYQDGTRSRWRNCMMTACVQNWRSCVRDLAGGFDSVGCHWLTSDQYPWMPPHQACWGGNFFWATSSFLQTLPSILRSPRVQASGLKAPESRFEAEVWIGNGPRLPRIKDYHPGWPFHYEQQLPVYRQHPQLFDSIRPPTLPGRVRPLGLRLR